MACREFQNPDVNRQSLSVARNRAGLLHLDRLQLALFRVVVWA